MVRAHRRAPLVLVIFDGWGVAKPGPGNAIALAKTPHWNALNRDWPHTTLAASSRRVGLPPYQAGNSEAGHMNLGAGRVVEQDAVVIAESINDGTFFKNAALRQAVAHVKQRKSKLHLMGLLSSEQSAHADPDHLLALISYARLLKVPRVYLHLFTDGRDAPRYAAIELVRRLKSILPPSMHIASVMGRFWGMDRAKRWDRTSRAYHTMVLGRGHRVHSSQEAILEGYNRGESDEFIRPTVVTFHGKPRGLVGDHDAVIFFNLRSDRARQMAKPFVQADFEARGGFRRGKILKDLCFVALTDFGPDLGNIITAFPSRDILDTLPMALASRRQLYVAEAEKFAHVTYFFNGGYDHAVAGEQRLMLPSIPLAHYDEKPQMSAYDITRVITKAITERSADVIVANYANADMVGHTGNLASTIAAVEHLDRNLAALWGIVRRAGGTLLITGDHGNAEAKLKLDTHEVVTAHSLNPVPLVVAGRGVHRGARLKRGGALCDVAPTVLGLLGIAQPPAMTGRNLLSAHSAATPSRKRSRMA